MPRTTQRLRAPGASAPGRFTFVAALAMAVLACGSAFIGGATTDPGQPRAARPSRIPLLTQPPRPSAATPGSCPAALLTGILVRDAALGLTVYHAPEGLWQVAWPYGFAAEDVGPRRALIDPMGNRVAFEGDRVSVDGGTGAGALAWIACGDIALIESASAADPSHVAVLTHAPRPYGALATCAAGAVHGILARADPPFGLILTGTNTGSWKIAWPYGYSAKEFGTRRALLDDEGRIVAFEGDLLEVGGSGSVQQIWSECGGIAVLPRPVPAISAAPPST